MVVWSGAELCITLLCIGVPVLRPLYKVVMKRGSTGNSGNPDSAARNQSYRMNSVNNRVFAGNSMDTEANARGYTKNNTSEERILGPEYKDNKIVATREVTVSYAQEAPADQESFDS